MKPPAARAGAAGHSLFVLVPRLAEMDVQVDQAGGDDFPGDIAHQRTIGCAAAASHAGDLAILNQQIADFVHVAARIDDPSSPKQDRSRGGGGHSLPPPFAASASSARPPASRYSTAIRTATPFVT